MRDKKRYRLAAEVRTHFIDRSKHRKDLCIIIAGYKPYLYQDVFERLIRFLPEQMDVCIVSSGIYSEELEKIASEHGWSYLSTKRNCVTLLQNVAILKHPDAEYIYKIDEDIFVTEHCFERMKETFLRVEKDGLYDVGFVAPLLPINGYCHLRILERLHLVSEYERRFERPIYASYSTRLIEKSPDAAKFFWGEGGYIPSIDEMASVLVQNRLRIQHVLSVLALVLFSCAGKCGKIWECGRCIQSHLMGVDEENRSVVSVLFVQKQ